MGANQTRIRRQYNLWSRGPLYQIGSFFALGPWQERLRGEAVQALRLSSGDSVLDVASGTGANLPFLEQAVGAGGRIVAIDFTPSMLARARARAGRHGWQNIKFVEADAAAMGFDGEFDGALCTLALTVIPRWTDALDAMVAAVKPGGRIAVLDAHYATKGIWRVLHPYLWLMDMLAASELRRDVAGALGKVVDDYQVSEHLSGAIFTASGAVPQPSARRSARTAGTANVAG